MRNSFDSSELDFVARILTLTLKCIYSFHSKCTCFITQTRLNLAFAVSNTTTFDMLSSNMQVHPTTKYQIKNDSYTYEVKVSKDLFSGINQII